MVKYIQSFFYPNTYRKQGDKTMVLTEYDVLEALQGAGLEEVMGPRGTFNASTPEEMAVAQKLLLQSGYYLSNSEMLERHVYVQTFMPLDSSLWPYWVTIRYIVNNGSEPPLVLAFFDPRRDTRVVVYSPRRTFGTGTSEAEKLLFEFKERYPDRQAFWLPVFEGSPFLD